MKKIAAATAGIVDTPARGNHMTQAFIYGLHAVAATLAHEPQRIHRLWVEQRGHNARIKALLDKAAGQGLIIQRVNRAELDRLGGNSHHQGIIAQLSGKQRTYSEADLPELLATVKNTALLLMLDGVQDPHNLGACLRSAAAAGVHAVIIPNDRAAGLNATVRKVASGGSEIVPLISVTNLARTLRNLQEHGLWVVGAAGEAKDSLYAVDFTSPTVIVMGAEDKGLRRLTRETCDRLARIPMAETGMDSLNVSVAAGIFLFEARRQRLEKINWPNASHNAQQIEPVFSDNATSS